MDRFNVTLTNKRYTILIVTLLVVPISSIPISLLIRDRVLKNDYFRGEIVIKKDADFVKRYNFPGEGTADDPYLLENLAIETSRDWGIAIIKTTKHFVIRNCTIKAVFPIHIDSVAPSTALITNNIIDVIFRVDVRIERGIFVQNSDGCIISNNYFNEQWSCENAIRLISSSSCEIKNNTCYGFVIAIYLGSCQFITISGNNCTNNYRDGILIENSNFIIIKNNFYRGVIGNFGYAGIQTTNSFDLQIVNNTCSNHYFGIWLTASPSLFFGNLIVSNNSCFNNLDSGIGIYGYSYGLIEFNYLKNNTRGLGLSNVNNSIIRKNVFDHNPNIGLLITYGKNNQIYHNNFNDNGFLDDHYYNGTQAYDELDSYNLWYNNNLEEGNYWSDLVWFLGVTYVIDGGDTVDLYPLENPVDI